MSAAEAIANELDPYDYDEALLDHYRKLARKFVRKYCVAIEAVAAELRKEPFLRGGYVCNLVWQMQKDRELGI